jgi:DNA-binding transcriptional regulator LsrR (DeoR family)
MARLRRAAAQAVSEDASVRLRASWLYYVHGLTQKDVSVRLGISRGTVIRLLEDAKQRGEVQMWIAEGDPDSIALALKLEDAFGLDEAIVVPEADSVEVAARSVGLALGRLLSEVVTDHMTIGVGWGRTLMASLASLRPVRHDDVRIVSLIGGIIEARGGNPLEYAWRMASQFGGECFLFTAPVFVDSPETKRRLIEKCGLDALYRLAGALDLVIVGAGDIGTKSTALAAKMITRSELDQLVGMGAVCDVLCNFLDADGRSVPHPLNKRVMSVELDDIRKAAHVIIATGGAGRAPAIRAAIRRIGCNTLITDQSAARALLAGKPLPRSRTARR